MLLISGSVFSAPDRVALIIGNSKYEELGTLSNTVNDAKSIDKVLKEIGFKTKLVLDDNQTTLRKDIKNFASESEGSSIALVFYAGHGAQVNGENYILPTDIEIPKRESDIQLSALKVDDIVNSLKSKTKIVFLDACRDNPALIKSLSRGRGSYRGGLAPAKTSSFDDQTGGIFIAYATDAGNVALDGEGQQNSPFTKALLKYIKEPVSIDDMFSMVTKDVRASTNNAQKPYKYASLDGVICLTSRCGTGATGVEIYSASNQNLTPRNLSSDSMQDVKNWVLINNTFEPKQLIYVQPSSYKVIGDRTTIDTKWEDVSGSNFSSMFTAKGYPYRIDSMVMNCKNESFSNYQSNSFDASGQKTKDIKYGDPETTSLEKMVSDNRVIVRAFYALACNKMTMRPLISPKNINSSDWQRLWTTDIEKGVDLYYYKPSVSKSGDEVSVTVKLSHSKPYSLSLEVGTGYENFPNTPVIKDVVIRDVVNCSKKTMTPVVTQVFDKNGDLVASTIYQDWQIPPPMSTEGSKLNELLELVCKS